MLRFIKWLTVAALFFVCFEPRFTQAGPVDPFPFTQGSDEGFPAAGKAPNFPIKSGESCNRIDFDNYQLVSGIAKNSWLLPVSGKMPSDYMTVSISPVLNATPPVYWEINVVGCMATTQLSESETFAESAWLKETVGEKGIKLVGATKRVKIDVEKSK
jgi:hypothetical protein